MVKKKEKRRREVKHHGALTLVILAPTRWHRSSDRGCLSESLERQYSTKGETEIVQSETVRQELVTLWKVQRAELG